MLWNLATVWWDLSSQHTLATLQHVCSLVTEADRSLKLKLARRPTSLNTGSWRMGCGYNSQFGYG
jgi:hypothetical protein